MESRLYVSWADRTFQGVWSQLDTVVSVSLRSTRIFLSSNVVFHSIESVGSLSNFLNAGSSKSEEIICFHSEVFSTTLAFPLSAGRIVRFMLFLRVFITDFSVFLHYLWVVRSFL